jgi:hypothetical protein
MRGYQKIIFIRFIDHFFDELNLKENYTLTFKPAAKFRQRVFCFKRDKEF